MLVLKPEMRFANKYTLVKLLGTGGFSQVWLAKRDSGFLQALKIYTGLDEDGVKIFREEFERVYNLNHHLLLKPSDFGVFEHRPFLIMPYCKNGSLLNKMGELDEKGIARVMANIGSALNYLHNLPAYLIHQDIKPDNFLIGDDGSYLLTDFGISTRFRSTLKKSQTSSSRETQDIRRTSSGITPPSYRGPELFAKDRNTREPIKATDIWALGASMYELATGELPYGEFGGLIQAQGTQEPDLPAHFSKKLNYILEKCMEKEPWDRPTAADLVKWGTAYLNTGTWPVTLAQETSSSQEQAAAPTGLSYGSSNKKAEPINSTLQDAEITIEGTKKKRPGLFIILGLLLLGGCGGGIFWAWQNNIASEATSYYETAEREFGTGKYYEARKDYEEAREIKASIFPDIDHIIQTCTDSIKAGEARFISIGEQAIKNKDYPAAMMAFGNVLKINPESNNALEQQKRIEGEVNRAFKKAMTTANTELRKENFDAATTAVEEALALKPDAKEAADLEKSIAEASEEYYFIKYIKKAESALAKEDFDEAEEAIRGALKVRKTDYANELEVKIRNERATKFDNYVQAGDAAANSKDCKKAKKNYNKALAINPNRSKVRTKISNLKCIPTAKLSTRPNNTYDCTKFENAEITEKYTILTVKLRKASCNGKVSFFGPGSKNAYVVKAGGKIYKLKKLEGISAGVAISVTADRTVRLYFERLPVNTTQLNLREGEKQIDPGTTYWNFDGIGLKWQ